MASDYLVKTVMDYERHIAEKGISEKVLEYYMLACNTALYNEHDIEFGLRLCKKLKAYVDSACVQYSGVHVDALESWAQQNGQRVGLIETFYDVLRLEAYYSVDSFALYIERDKPKAKRLYEPRRSALKKVMRAVQRLEDGELDEVFIHQPPRTGKTLSLSIAVLWHCLRDTSMSNLYVTYKEGLGGAFIDGVLELMGDPYRVGDIFPNIGIVDTDAKNNKVDLGVVKKYKSLSAKGIESGLNGEYDASGWLIVDDPLEGVQDVMNPTTLHRKQEIFENNVMSRRRESCKILWNGTVWGVNDIFGNRMNFLQYNPEAGDIRYDVIKIPALDPKTDQSNFDYEYGLGFSTKYYRTLRAKHEENNDMAGWWAQYMQEPIDRDGQVFNAEQFTYYNGVLPDEEPLKVIAHCDSALGGGDFTSFPILYIYADGRIFMPDVVFDNSEKHITQPQVVSKIKKHNIKNVHFESNQGGEGYKDDVAKALKADKSFNGGRPINITSSWAPVNQRKEQRIWDHAEAIRNIIFLDPAHRDKQYRMFMQNLFSFQMGASKGKHDDAPDSLAGALDFEAKGSGVASISAISNPFRRG